MRFVGNRSSGRMGVALAAEARRRGADVTLLAANLAVAAPAGVELVATPTAADLEREALARADADVVIMAAAVADYAPEQIDGKRPKDGDAWTLALHPTVDILRELGARPANGRVLVGFAADVGEHGLERARAKRHNKNANLLVFNDVERTDIGFDATENEVTLVGPDGERRIAKAPKELVAAAILDEVVRLLEEEHG